MVGNDGESYEVDVKDEEVFEEDQTALFYTHAPGHYQQYLQSKRLSRTSVV